MKKLLAFILALTMLFALAACGGETIETTKNNSEETSSSQNEDAIDNSKNNEEENKEEIDKADEISFTEVVAVDNDECAIKITGIDPDNLWGFTLKAQLENKSLHYTTLYIRRCNQ